MSKKSKVNKNKFSVLTLGCSKNAVDSEMLIAGLKSFDYEFTNNIEKSDTLIINTCGFIKPAKEESIGVILEAAEMKRQGKLKKLIVTGCLSERYMEELSGQIDMVDHFFGINSAELISKALIGEYRENLLGETRVLTPPHFAYIKISDGCDHPCSFCAIPLIRGKYNSRTEEDITAEITALAQKGTKEFILIAQDTTYYGVDLNKKKTIASLLERISDIKGVEWVRLMYTYPTGFPMDLLDVINRKDNICKYIDIPLQHTSDDLLKSMRRGITSKKVKELIKNIRQTIPGVTIRSTFITGYPGETDEEFNKLLDFINEYELDRVGIFTYSREEDTFAFDLGDPIPEELKEERRNILMEAQMKISHRKNKAKIGNVYTALVDELSEGKLIARTEADAPEVDNSVIINSSEKKLIGKFVKVRITDATEYDLMGELA